MTDDQVSGVRILGPFMGFVDEGSAKIWVYLAGVNEGETTKIFISLHPGNPISDASHRAFFTLTADNLGADVVTFEGLSPDTTYHYRLWNDEQRTSPFDLDGLTPEDLHFRTFPTDGFNGQLDFLLVSCHNPVEGSRHGLDGFGVWKSVPQIIKQNKNVRFIIMCGDQVYADGVEKQLLAEPDLRKRKKLYLGIYRSMWNDLAYRKALCSLPSILMWDDHDITDGWGSLEGSFKDGKSLDFKTEWCGLFEAAKGVFQRMQAIRNPSFNSPTAFDTCFKIGRAAFVIPDLRSNRNVRKGQMWSADQFNRIQAWVESMRQDTDTLFFVSSVVFSHGDPKIETSTIAIWPLVLRFVAWVYGRLTKQSRVNSAIRSVITSFNQDCGDLRDDINDSWGSEVNADETDRVLDWLFRLQNPDDGSGPLNVVILSGDIHTPGYSTIYSSTPDLARPSIPHIVSTPVAYQPFSWFMEAVYRHLTKAVKIGKKDVYTAQVSHHFCHRTVVLLSLRSIGEEGQLKVKYYLEGFPEPQILLFDLSRASHKENIQWNAPGEGTQQSPVPA